MRGFRPFVVASMLLAVFVAGAMGRGAAEPAMVAPLPNDQFTIEEVLGAAFPSGLTAAVDGTAVAWVLNEQGARNVWVAEAPEFAGRRLTPYREDDGQEIGSLQFTADGSTLIYGRGGAPNRGGEIPNPVSEAEGTERAIFAIDVAGGEPRQLAEGSGPLVAPSGDGLVYRAQGGLWWTSAGADAEATEVRQVMAPRGGIGALVWSPSGDRLVFASNRGTHAFIGVVALAGGPITWLDPSVDSDGSPAWSPDGERIAFVRVPARPTNRTTRIFAPVREAVPWSIRVAAVSGGTSTWVFSAEAGYGSAPTGVGGIGGLAWGADDRLVFPWERSGWRGLYSVAVDGGEPRALAAGEFEVETALLRRDRRETVYNANQEDINGRNLWVVPVDGSRGAERVTAGDWVEWSPAPVSGGMAFLRSNATIPAHAVVMLDGAVRGLAPEAIPASFPSAQLVQPESVIFAAADGMPIHGQLFLPSAAESGERRPAILFFHGGSRRQMLPAFHYMGYYHNAYALNQYLASRGYVVLAVNYRSGVGYGLEFREALNYGATGASEFNDVLGAGLYLRGRDDVDPARIGLWGGSYGGYLTALGLARASDLFAAGVDIHGVHDWNVGIRNFVPSYDPDEDTERLAFESSPMAALDTWRSPVLVIHGDDDRNVQFSETVDLVEALRARNVHVEQLIFPDEVHGFLLHRNWLRAYAATADFFDRKLAGASR